MVTSSESSCSHLYVILFYGVLWFLDLVNRKLNPVFDFLELSSEIYLNFKIYRYSKRNKVLMGFSSILRFVFFKKSFSLAVKVEGEKDYFFSPLFISPEVPPYDIWDYGFT